MATMRNPVYIVAFLGVFLAQSSNGQLCHTCPDDWITLDNSCYRYFGKPQTWHDANDVCEKLEADLPSIHSYEESNRLYILWKGLVENPNVTSKAYWLGLHDATSERIFLWTDGSPVDFMNWAAGQPSDTDGTEDCVEVYNMGSTDMEKQRWNDVDCNQQKAFFCEKSFA